MMETRRQPMFGRIRHIYMVGIGGIGMSSIAEVLLTRGFEVSGSDLSTTDVTSRLSDLGARIYEGHAASHIGDADVVVYSSAVNPKENPETAEAARKRLPLIPRSVMLGELMRTKFGIGIAGTHGKTTTTTMAGLVVAEGGFDPTIIVGGKVSEFGSNAVAGEGDVLLVEADEYDRTFLRLTPSVAVITNIEEEHLDIYSGLDDLLAAFSQFASSVPFFGAAILCLDDPNVQRIVGRIDRRVVTYGTTRQAEVRAERIRQDGLSMEFEVLVRGKLAGTARIDLPGEHNVQNALAAIAVGLELQIPFDAIVRGLARFKGVQRRLHQIGTVNDVLVVDDYAHHPTEILATLTTAAETWKDRRILAVFQPHLYSRTRDFADEFARAFFNADILIVTDIYASREDEIEGVTGTSIAEGARRFGHRNVFYAGDRQSLVAQVAALAQPGDVVVAMGAGDIWRFSRELLTALGDTVLKDTALKNPALKDTALKDTVLDEEAPA